MPCILLLIVIVRSGFPLLGGTLLLRLRGLLVVPPVLVAPSSVVAGPVTVPVATVMVAPFLVLPGLLPALPLLARTVSRGSSCLLAAGLRGCGIFVRHTFLSD